MTAATTPGSRPPLELPFPGAPWAEAMRRFFLKYATFRGRASRSEFWWWILTGFVATTALRTLSSLTSGDPGSLDLTDAMAITDAWSGLLAVGQLAVFVPFLAVSWRRLHDTDRTGAWIFVCFVPIVGLIVYAIMAATGSRPGGARFD